MTAFLTAALMQHRHLGFPSLHIASLVSAVRTVTVCGIIVIGLLRLPRHPQEYFLQRRHAHS
jgi:hypothetical protein